MLDTQRNQMLDRVTRSQLMSCQMSAVWALAVGTWTRTNPLRGGAEDSTEEAQRLLLTRAIKYQCE